MVFWQTIDDLKIKVQEATEKSQLIALKMEIEGLIDDTNPIRKNELNSMVEILNIIKEKFEKS